MTMAARMLAAQPIGLDGELPELVARVVDAAGACAVACTACAGSCLMEEDPAPLVQCAVACLDCADLCDVTVRMLMRPLDNTRRETGVGMLEVCASGCESAAVECGRHELTHEHCRACALACRACLELCQDLIAAV